MELLQAAAAFGVLYVAMTPGLIRSTAVWLGLMEKRKSDG